MAGLSGAWKSKTRDPERIPGPRITPRDLGEDRQQDVGNRGSDWEVSNAPPSEDMYYVTADADVWADGGFGYGTVQVHIPREEQIPEGRNLAQGRGADTGQDASIVKDRTDGTEHLKVGEVHAVTHVSEPLGEFVPPAARTRGHTALPENNSHARKAVEWFNRYYPKDRYFAWRGHDERPIWNNPAQTAVDTPSRVGGVGGSVYRALESFVNNGLRDPSRVRAGTPDSPVNVEPSSAEDDGINEIGVVVHLG